MKSLYAFLAVLYAGTVLALSQGETHVSVDFFHDNLDSYGDWREIGNLGYCWQPRDMDRNWRPYSDGRWLYTDAGWTWDSDEPYSWAVYHYGRWARVDTVGWVWVPGTEWGPGWVSWRSSPSHVGWAPLSPEAEFDRSAGFDSRVDAEYDIGPMSYNFVENRNFGAPHLREVLIDPRDNITIFSQSTNITRITYVNDVVHDDGPPYDAISRESAQPIPRLKLERQPGLGGDAGGARAGQLQDRVDGSSLRVLSIPFDARPATAPRKVGAKVESAAVDRGWNNAGPPAEVAKLRASVKNGTAAPAGLPESKPATTAQAPIASPAPNGKLPQEKAARSERSAIPVPAIAKDVTPPPKPVNAEAGSPRPSPLANEETAPPSHSGKSRNKGGETPHPAVEGHPDGVKNGGSPKGDIPPKLEPPGARSVEHNIPDNPGPPPESKRPEPPTKAAPAVTHSQPTPPAKEKGKGKGKEDKKDEGKPPGPPQ